MSIDKIFAEKGNNTIYVNVANPALVKPFRSKGFISMNKDELPEDLQEELTGIEFADQIQKWMKHKVGWFDLIKAPLPKMGMSNKKVTRGMWKGLARLIHEDRYLKGDKETYVRFSSLGKKNQEMVDWYLERGFKFPEKRLLYMQGIVEEMLRDSTVRYSVEDRSRGD